MFGFLRSNGEPVKEEESLQLKIEQVPFEEWAIHQAEFLKKSIHNGNEIAMAFFPNKLEKATLEDSASERMMKMNLDDLKSDVAVEFDLYVYMPENNKYLLYTPQGMVFYGKQKDRLKDKGIGHMHLRKESVTNVKKYKAQIFFKRKNCGL